MNSNIDEQVESGRFGEIEVLVQTAESRARIALGDLGPRLNVASGISKIIAMKSRLYNRIFGL